MFDLGWSELLLIAVITLLVVGPKELPQVLRTGMQWMRKARQMAGDFQSGLNDIVREAELDDLRKSVNDARSIGAGGPQAAMEKLFDPTSGAMMKDIEAALQADAQLVKEKAQAAPPPSDASPPKLS